MTYPDGFKGKSQPETMASIIKHGGFLHFFQSNLGNYPTKIGVYNPVT